MRVIWYYSLPSAIHKEGFGFQLQGFVSKTMPLKNSPFFCNMWVIKFTKVTYFHSFHFLESVEQIRIGGKPNYGVGNFCSSLYICFVKCFIVRYYYLSSKLQFKVKLFVDHQLNIKFSKPKSMG